MWIISGIVLLLSLLFAYIIIDIGLSSIFAYFHIEAWIVFSIIGLIIGLIKALSDDHWYVLTPLFFGFIGYIIAVFKFDGIIISIFIACFYSWIHDRCE